MHVNETAEFRCQHSTADGIRWKVNGSVLSSVYFPPGVQQRVENRLYILTIMGMPEYNGTEVVGDAFHFTDGSSLEETEPVALLEGMYTSKQSVMTRLNPEICSVVVIVVMVVVVGGGGWVGGG